MDTTTPPPAHICAACLAVAVRPSDAILHTVVHGSTHHMETLECASTASATRSAPATG